jgi:hypothetical protein
MISASGLTSAIHLILGFFVYWIFQGWAVASETLAPDMPTARQSGRFSFVAGQGIAFLAQSSLALLCAHALSPIIEINDLVFLPLGAAGLLFALESVWIASGSTLPAERRPIDYLSFSGGRDLLLRHASGLFLIQGLLAMMHGTRAAATQTTGSLLAWSTSVMLWEVGARPGALSWLRWILAPLALFLGIILLRQGWNAF